MATMANTRALLTQCTSVEQISRHTHTHEHTHTHIYTFNICAPSGTLATSGHGNDKGARFDGFAMAAKRKLEQIKLGTWLVRIGVRNRV